MTLSKLYPALGLSLRRDHAGQMPRLENYAQVRRDQIKHVRLRRETVQQNHLCAAATSRDSETALTQLDPLIATVIAYRLNYLCPCHAD
jgi:hypothetical protein